MYLHVLLVENSAMEVTVKGTGLFSHQWQIQDKCLPKNRGTAVTLSD